MFQSLVSLLLASALSFSSGSGQKMDTGFDDSSLLTVNPIPHLTGDPLEKNALYASSALVIDLESQSILFEKDSYTRLPIASLTKLMTAYIILEENDPSSIVTVSNRAADAEGSQMRLAAGEQITVKNLLYGLLIQSGNDAAIALAEFNAGSETAFIKKMNAEAKNLGLENTYYANTTGLDSTSAYSTTHDLLILSTQLLKNSSIREIAKNSSIEVTGTNGEVHKLINTNILLGQLGVEGLKTGTTPLAGECLLSLVKTDEGNEILIVILGSSDRFLDTKILIDWVNTSYTW